MKHHTARRFGLLAALPLLAGTIASAQFKDQADIPELVPTWVNPDEAADMVFEVLEHDFGLISDSEKAEFVFKFTNKGKGTLTITSTKGSCSCTVPALSKKSFEPGESGDIRVIFDPKGKAGTQAQSVTLNTNDAETPVILLRVAANVMPQVMVKPRIAHFGEVAKDTGGEIVLSVIGRDPAFEVTGFELSDPDLFDVEVGETFDSEYNFANDATLAPGQTEAEAVIFPVRECKVTVHFKPGNEIGLVRNKLLTLYTNDEKNNAMPVELMAQHVGDIQMVPRRISLGSLVAGTEFRKDVVVKSATGASFNVVDIEHSSVVEDAVKFTVEPLEPGSTSAYKISLVGTMPADTRVLRGRLVVRTDMDREEELFLHYYGQLRPTTTSSNGR